MTRQRKAAGRIASRSVAAPLPRRLLADVRTLIEQTRGQVARTVNSALVGLYWHIGKRIREDVLKEQRAEYGGQIVSALSAQLTAEYGRGFSRSNLFAMIQFAEAFPNVEIVQTLSGQLSWSHFQAIVPIQDRLKREFYAEMCRVERWSVRTLRHKIDHLLFERTAVARKPEKLIARGGQLGFSQTSQASQINSFGMRISGGWQARTIRSLLPTLSHLSVHASTQPRERSTARRQPR